MSPIFDEEPDLLCVVKRYILEMMDRFPMMIGLSCRQDKRWECCARYSHKMGQITRSEKMTLALI